MLTSCIHDFRLCWRSLVATDIVYKVIGFVVLTPLVALLFRGCLAFSGTSVLADQDILFFFLGPVGWFSLIVVGAAWIAIVALEQAALMAIVAAAGKNGKLRVRTALGFVIKHVWDVLRVTGSMIALAILTAAPFLAAAGTVYLALLTEFDVNYYLAEKPSEFWLAAALIGLIGAVLVVLLAGLLVRWMYAMPLLLFENTPPRQTLKTSRSRTTGHRSTILLWIGGWLAATLALSAVGTGAVGLIGRLIVPAVTGSLGLLLIVVGAMLILWALVNIVTTLLSATTFSVLLVNLYRTVGGQGDIDLEKLIADDSTGAAPTFRVSRRVLIFGSAGAVLLAATVGVAALGTVRLADDTTITAHRGASAAAPENSMASVTRAIEDDTDWVEIDVQESSDGVVMVVHDADLKKLAGVDMKIWESTAEELRAVDIGTAFAPEFAGEKLPTLDEVLAACKGKAGLNIELKYYGHDQRLEQRVIELVEAHRMELEVVIMSLDAKGVAKIRQLRPTWKVGLLTAVAVGDLTTADVDFLAVNVGLATRGFVRAAHESGKEVYAWTVNDPITMSAMIGRGVDSLITDEPALARGVLRQRAELSSVERLLVELALLFGVTPHTKDTIDSV